MAPVKLQPLATKTTRNSVMPLARRPISTRAHKNVLIDSNNMEMVGKRKADASPVRSEKVKRSALGNLTNAVLNFVDDGNKKSNITTNKARDTFTHSTGHSHVNINSNNENGVKTKTKFNVHTMDSLFPAPNMQTVVPVPQRQTKVMTRAASRASQPTKQQTIGSDAIKNRALKSIENKTVTNTKEISTTVVKAKKSKNEQLNKNGSNGETRDVQLQKTTTRRISNEFDLNENEESHYMSALEDFSSSALRLSVDTSDAVKIATRRKSRSSVASESSETTFNTLSNESSQTSSQSSTITTSQSDITLSLDDVQALKLSDPPTVPDGVIDFDKENWDDPSQASHYAMDIFNYLKEREQHFIIESYMHRQPHLTAWMRTLLVDWMVEVQETFELNHETLYLAVKLVDIYLGKVVVIKEKLQLLGAAALFMACKYDERTPPLIEDFLYICDGAYTQTELTRMEMKLFRTIGYDLGIPLSYRFLRRYARCAKVAMPELTLARYILEFSLMNYDVITFSDSKMASACLFMALRMNNKPGWNNTLEYFSGYKLSEFESIIPILNASLHQKHREANKTIRHKYTHKIFFEVSKIPLMTTEKLLEKEEHC